jgi:hypothetical protein
MSLFRASITVAAIFALAPRQGRSAALMTIKRISLGKKRISLSEN